MAERVTSQRSTEQINSELLDSLYRVIRDESWQLDPLAR